MCAPVAPAPAHAHAEILADVLTRPGGLNPEFVEDLWGWFIRQFARHAQRHRRAERRARRRPLILRSRSAVRRLRPTVVLLSRLEVERSRLAEQQRELVGVWV